MARSEGFLPTVPLSYRGIEVCDHVANRWIAYEGTMWRMGVDQALDAALKTVEDECHELTTGGTHYYSSEWADGLYEGKERAAENIKDMMNTYKKESN